MRHAEPEARWWAALPGSGREKLTGAVLDFLTGRGLLRPPAEPQPAAAGRPGPRLVTAALGMIVAARQYPAVVVVATEPDGSAAGTPRMYGIGNAAGLPRAVVGEHVSGKLIRPFGLVHYFSLLSAARAGHVLGRWATRANGTDRPGENPAGGQSRTVDVYTYRDGELAGRDRAVVSGSGDGHVVTRQRPAVGVDPGPPFACDLPDLAGLLTGMLALEQP